MNIIQYVRAYGDKQFSELPFNEIDSLIFSELAYINFHLVTKDTEFVKLKNLVINDPKTFYQDSVDAKKNEKLLLAMMNSKRFSDVKVGYCKLIKEEKRDLQFFAMTLIMPNREAYIAYRGTDTSLLGWRESAKIIYEKRMPGQENAIEYIKNAATLFKGKFYIGGHSKGGYLAMCAAIYMGEPLEERLIKAYTFDGPGLREDVESIPSYRRLENKLEKYLTSHDVIGVVYNRIKNIKIVYSTGILLGGHDPFKWMVNQKDMTFVYTKDRSFASKRSEEAMMNWLTKEKDEDKRLAVDVLFDMCGESKTIYDLLLNASRLIANGRKKVKEYSQRQRDEAKEIFRRLGRYYLDSYSPRRFLIERKKSSNNEEK